MQLYRVFVRCLAFMFSFVAPTHSEIKLVGSKDAKLWGNCGNSPPCNSAQSKQADRVPRGRDFPSRKLSPRPEGDVACSFLDFCCLAPGSQLEQYIQAGGSWWCLGCRYIFIGICFSLLLFFVFKVIGCVFLGVRSFDKYLSVLNFFILFYAGQELRDPP